MEHDREPSALPLAVDPRQDEEPAEVLYSTSAMPGMVDPSRVALAVALRRKPVATFALLGLIVAVFGAQLLAGFSVMGEGSVGVLVRMGANARGLSWSEPWRLMSATVLHGSLLHIAFNGLALHNLGRLLEPLFGTRRFLFLYIASGIGGSLVSVAAMGFTGSGVSVGASGAIFGLFGALGALVLRPNGILPTEVAARMRGQIMGNIVLNVVVSFQPHVDWAAHVGGALVGVVLVGSGMLSMGLPRYARGELREYSPLWLRVGTGVLMLALAAGVGAALVGAVAPAKRVAWSRQSIAPGWTADFPRGLIPQKLGETSDGEVLYLQPEHDLRVAVKVATIESSATEEQLPEMLQSFSREVSVPRDRVRAAGYPKIHPHNVLLDRVTGDGWTIDRAFRVFAGDRVVVLRVDSYMQDGKTPPGAEDLAGRVVKTAAR